MTLRHPLNGFSLNANPQSWAKWSAPSNDVLIYDESDFRDGGRDVFRCGPANDLIQRDNHLSRHCSKSMCRIDGTHHGERRILGVALNTLQIEPTGQGSSLTVTIQIASFVGPEMIRGYEFGNRAALRGLSAFRNILKKDRSDGLCPEMESIEALLGAQKPSHDHFRSQQILGRACEHA